MKHGPGYHECPDTGCWIWFGAINGDGYGVMRLGGKVVYAHAVMFEERSGPLPPGLEHDHICPAGPNRACCNPDHLEGVPRVVNIQRGRRAKLTPDQVRAIRSSARSTVEEAKRYGVAQCTISHIRLGNTWVDLEAA